MTDEPFEKVELPSGGWVSFRDPKSLTRSQRKPITRAQSRIGIAIRDVVAEGAPAASVPDEDIDLFEGLMHAMTAALIEEWSFPVEINAAAIDGLQDADYRVLIKAAEKHRAALEQDPAGLEPGPKEDEHGVERPTGLSPESGTTSAGEPQQDRSPTRSSPLGGS